jgi:hypothetical protein
MGMRLFYVTIFAIFFWGGDGASIGGFAVFFEGGLGKNRFFAWCFGGEFVVGCVTIVDLRHHVVWSLKTCHFFEIYFRSVVEKRGSGRFGNSARRY